MSDLYRQFQIIHEHTVQKNWIFFLLLYNTTLSDGITLYAINKLEASETWQLTNNVHEIHVYSNLNYYVPLIFIPSVN
jgi:hypothetical protein